MAVNAMCVCEYCVSYVPIYIVFTIWQKDTREIIFKHITSFRVCPPCLTRSCRGMQCLFNRLIFSLFLHVLNLSRAILCLLFTTILREFFCHDICTLC